MSRQMHLVETTPEQLQALYKRARVASLVLFVGFFTLFVAFAPEGDSPAPAAPAVASAAVTAELP